MNFKIVASSSEQLHYLILKPTTPYTNIKYTVLHLAIIKLFPFPRKPYSPHQYVLFLSLSHFVRVCAITAPIIVRSRVVTNDTILDLTDDKPAATNHLHLNNGFLPSFTAHNHNCPQCGREYKHRHNMINHMRYECGQRPKFMCPYCGLHCKLKGNFKKHLQKQHHDQMVAAGTTAYSVAESQCWESKSFN